jgi:hypothetical protein
VYLGYTRRDITVLPQNKAIFVVNVVSVGILRHLIPFSRNTKGGVMVKPLMKVRFPYDQGRTDIFDTLYSPFNEILNSNKSYRLSDKHGDCYWWIEYPHQVVYNFFNHKYCRAMRKMFRAKHIKYEVVNPF